MSRRESKARVSTALQQTCAAPSEAGRLSNPQYRARISLNGMRNVFEWPMAKRIVEPDREARWVGAHPSGEAFTFRWRQSPGSVFLVSPYPPASASIMYPPYSLPHSGVILHRGLPGALLTK